MTKLHRVLAAVDFSKPARSAFDHALALSRMHDAELTVVHAIPTDRPIRWDARERIRLMALLGDAATAAGVRFKVSVHHGDPAGVIVLQATARRADLIVIGTSRRSGLDRFRYGSVAETVAREATQPVLVVPEGTAADPITAFKNVVVAVDFREGSSAAIERALAMADGNSRVTVVHVVPDVAPGFAARRLSHGMASEYQRHVVQDAWRTIAATIPASARTSRQVHARVVTGVPSQEIARIAAEADADLILVGVTARGAIGRLLFGSTAARVMRTSGRPVLAIPQPQLMTAALDGDEDRWAVAA